MERQDREDVNRCWGSLNYVLWFSIVLIFLVVQILVSVVFLIVSKNEKPQVPLREWNAGYLSGCIAASALLIWGYSVQKKVFTESLRSIVGTTGQDADNQRAETCVRFLKLIMHCFFAAWFVVGCIWISKASSSRSDTPLLFRLCLLNLIFCSIGYTMWILTNINMCFCLPCVLYIYAAFGWTSK